MPLDQSHVQIVYNFFQIYFTLCVCLDCYVYMRTTFAWYSQRLEGIISLGESYGNCELPCGLLAPNLGLLPGVSAPDC